MPPSVAGGGKGDGHGGMWPSRVFDGEAGSRREGAVPSVREETGGEEDQILGKKSPPNLPRRAAPAAGEKGGERGERRDRFGDFSEREEDSGKG